VASYIEIAGQLVHDSHGRGIQESSQSVLSRRTGVPIGYGVCAGLVAGWLKARKTSVDFWKMSGNDKTTPLLGEHKTLEQAAATQSLATWAALKDELSQSALNCSHETPYTAGVRGMVNTIAGKVMGDAENFYVLSWKGASDAHETAFHRPWQWIGKSETARFYDPNYGEFEVSKQGILTVLTSIGIDYANMAVSCTLRSFDG
jgi:hypothetical protein